MSQLHWSEFGLRNLPPMSARSLVTGLPPFLQQALDERTALLPAPLVGVTSEDSVRSDLYQLQSTGVETRPIAEAAQAFLAALTPDQRAKAQFPLEATERRTWINVHMNFFRHGVMLEDLPPATRELGLGLLRASLSARGYGLARDIMRLNQFLADLTGSADEYGEWPYFVSIFGDPAGGQPWAWQIDGHHLNVNATIIGDQLVLTPTFMGSEPCQVHEGRFAGTQVFATEEQVGLNLIRALDTTQATKAILRRSIHPDDLPDNLQHPFDGRMQAGAFHDNAFMAPAGVRATDLTDAQRRLLLNVAGAYVGWTRDGHNQVRMDEVARHLDETWFSWMGATDDEGPFYYRVHSPVVLIEFDHHPGVVFDNLVPSRNHIHTVVRTPNGGDYGVDLLRRHHEQYDHSHGTHEPRHTHGPDGHSHDGHTH